MAQTRRSRKPLTPEQQAAYEARRARIKELLTVIAAMSETDRQALAAKITVTTCEGRRLSAFNHCMVVNQMEDATIIGGLHQWREQGRKVRKGEHGLYIWVPAGERDAQGQTVFVDEKRFVLVAVFDVSQT